MRTRMAAATVAATAAMLFGACASPPAVPVESGSVVPGTSIVRRGQPVRLLGASIAVGSPLPATTLVDAATMRPVDLAQERGRVLLLSLIVSVDTAV